MRYSSKLIIIIIGLLFYNTILPQERNSSVSPELVSEKKWENIVDYLNAEVTAMAMLEHKLNKKALDPKEQNGLNEVSEVLIENSIENPILFSELETILNQSWGKTLNNISRPIDSLKNLKPAVLDSLFIKVEDILVHRSSEIGQNPTYKQLKNEIILSQQTIENKIVNQSEASNTSASVPRNPLMAKEKNSFNSYWMIPIIFLLGSTILFFIMWRTEKKKNRENEKKNLLEAQNHFDDIKILKQKLNDQKEKYSSITSKSESSKGLQSFQKDDVNVEPTEEEINSPVIDLTTSETIKEPKILFSGKPTKENRFTTLSKTPITNQTIYKLTIHDDGIKADFEVDLVDDFITREVTNAPDDYLYRVCNQVNSNKDFSREIITVKKGLAILIDGYWNVQESNKATIKFQ